MCRGFQPNERELLKIKAFHTRLSLSSHLYDNHQTALPYYLTLHFLPRINGALLQINGSSIRPGSPGFVTLHRVLNTDGGGYGSRERVVVCEGARFEVYAGDVKVLKGIFRRDHDEREIKVNRWRMECKCANDVVPEGMKGAEVSVVAEGAVKVMTESVEMRRRRRRRRCELEEIPEEEGWDVCWCGGVEEEETETEKEEEEEEMEMEMERVRWALDVGIWVMCFGVGYLVCRSRRRNQFM